MKRDMILGLIVAGIVILFMIVFGFIYLLQTNYNWFVTLLFGCCTLLVVTLWKIGVDIEDTEEMKAFDEE